MLYYIILYHSILFYDIIIRYIIMFWDYTIRLSHRFADIHKPMNGEVPCRMNTFHAGPMQGEFFFLTGVKV